MSSFLIHANYYANWASAIMTVANVAWILEMVVTAIIQHKDLNAYVNANWKAPLIICLILSIIAAGILYIPLLGMTAYVISVFGLCAEIFFMSDYRKTLERYIKRSWYLTTTKVVVVWASLTALVVFIFAVSSIAVTDY